MNENTTSGTNPDSTAKNESNNAANLSVQGQNPPTIKTQPTQNRANPTKNTHFSRNQHHYKQPHFQQSRRPVSPNSNPNEPIKPAIPLKESVHQLLPYSVSNKTQRLEAKKKRLVKKNIDHRQLPQNALTIGQNPRMPIQNASSGINSQKEKRSFASRLFFGGRTREKLRVICLGGLNEVGKNCMVLEYGNDIILIDLGFQFPEEDMLGVDYILPDTNYLNDKLHKIRGIIFTHGHLDHIGAVPYLIPKLNFPAMYGTKLTMGLINKRLEEFGLLDQSKVRTVTAEDSLRLGAFQVSFFPVNHSIPDAIGVVVKTPAGNIVHTGDFKFDFTPAGNQKSADFARIGGLARENIHALFIDSTNALKAGYTVSEKVIGESLEEIFKNIKGRIVIASFATQIGRIQQIVNLAQKYHKKIYISGRSIIDNIYISKKLGYLKVPEGLIQDVRKVKKSPDENAVILTTGSQGEDVSALTRMSNEEHPSVKIKKGDTVVLSSSPIPGNERAITGLTNNLCRLGAKIINNQIMDVHASGHAQIEDLKLMMSLVKSKYVVPVHGEYFMRHGNTEVAQSLGYDAKNTIMIENGDVIEIINGELKVTGEKIPCGYILVDGLGVGDISQQVILDRQTMAENGVLLLVIPVDEKTQKINGEVEVITRGFIYMKESEEIINVIKQKADESYRYILEKRSDLKRQEIKNYLREMLDKVVHEKTERNPLILPVIIDR